MPRPELLGRRGITSAVRILQDRAGPPGSMVFVHLCSWACGGLFIGAGFSARDRYKPRSSEWTTCSPNSS